MNKMVRYGLKLQCNLEHAKDEVLNRATMVPTYFAADIAYHQDKFARGFDWVINIWGADHHGHVARMKGAMAALGIDPDRLDILLMQLVRLYRNGEIVRMSKRTGTTVTLDELIDEVGKDAARFFFVMRSPDSHLDFDLELARRQNQENPVYYVQYAHARMCSIFRQTQERGIKQPEIQNLCSDDIKKCLGTLHLQEEFDLIKKLADFPSEIKLAAENLSPYRITNYTMELASIFHSFYNKCKVLCDDKNLAFGRLLLVKSVQQVLQNCFGILGIEAPERM
jgi:arginyl-tRNA synthetase